MPAMIGGFGKIKENKKKVFYNTKQITNKKSNIGPYLAGLIEADGSIAVHDKNTKSKRYRPKILVVFSLPDKPLAERLAFITQTGKVYNKDRAGCVIWHIQKTEDVVKIINIINGYMRSPKIEALQRAITWYNEHDKTIIKHLPLDLSPIDSNAWLAGFSDGDANFAINLTNRKKKGKITSKRVQVFFRIELRQNYHRDASELQGGISYFNILSKIAAYLKVNVYSRTRYTQDKVFYSYMVISHNEVSHNLVKNYFSCFPMYSSKYLAFNDWSSVVDAIVLRNKKPLTNTDISEIEKVKAQFNNKRKIFDFSHLNCLVL